METKKRFTASLAPHIFAKDTTAVLMMDVIAALMPTVLAGVWLFGWDAARVVIICVASCVGFEFLSEVIFRRPITINDLSAVVTGISLAMNVPSTAPWWMLVVGSAVAITMSAVPDGALTVDYAYGRSGDQGDGFTANRGSLTDSWSQASRMISGETLYRYARSGRAIVQ